MFVNKSWNNYTLNLLARSQVISIPNVRIKTRNLPSINFEKRPSMLSFLKSVYFSFKTSVEGVSAAKKLTTCRFTGSRPAATRSSRPRSGSVSTSTRKLTMPFNTKYFNFTATAGDARHLLFEFIQRHAPGRRARRDSQIRRIRIRLSTRRTGEKLLRQKRRVSFSPRHRAVSHLSLCQRRQ